MRIQSASGEERPAMDIIAKSLEYMKKHSIAAISKTRHGLYFNIDMISFVEKINKCLFINPL